MKKFLSVLFAVMFATVAFASCSGRESEKDKEITTSSTQADEITHIQMSTDKSIFMSKEAREAYKKIVDKYAEEYGVAVRTSSAEKNAEPQKGIRMVDFFDWDADSNAEMFIAYSTKADEKLHRCDHFEVYTFKGGKAVLLLSEDPGVSFGTKSDAESFEFREKSGNLSLVVFDSSDPANEYNEKIYTFDGEKAECTSVNAVSVNKKLSDFEINGKSASEEEFNGIVSCDKTCTLSIYAATEKKNGILSTFLSGGEASYPCHSIFHKAYIFENDNEVWIYSDPHFGTVRIK